MSATTFFHEIGDEIALAFGHMPKDFAGVTNQLVTDLNNAKKFLESPGATTIAAMFPKGIGTAVDSELDKLVTEGLATIEIAQGAEQATSTITDPTAKADAIIQYILANIAKLPAEWQGKHWLNIAEKILESVLNITTTEANALVNTQLGLIKAGKA
jgi:hypothetical protein